MPVRQSERKALLALAFILCLTALVRYPRFPHAFGGDTLELQYYSDALRQDGTAVWAMSPLSWFGLYPISYSMGVPVLGAVVGDAAGISSETALSLCGIMIGILSTLGLTIIGHRLTGNMTVGLVCGAAIATSGFNELQTMAGLSGRPVAQAFFPFALWALLPPRLVNYEESRLGRTPRIAVLVLANLGMAAAHRLFLMALMAEFMFVVATKVYDYLSRIPRIASTRGNALRLPTWALAGGILAFGAFNLQPGARAGPSFLLGFLVSPDQTRFVAGYLLEFVWDVGPMIFFLPLGAYMLIRGRYRWSPSMAGLLITFAVILFIVVPSFSSVALAPLACVMAGYGWQYAGRAARIGSRFGKVAFQASLAVGILLALAVQAYIYVQTADPHRNPDSTSFYVDQESVESGVYLRWGTGSQSFVSPELTDSRRVAAGAHIATFSSEAIIISQFPYIKENLTIVYSLEGYNNLLDLRLYIDAASALVASKTLYSAQDWIIPGAGYGLGFHWGEVVTLSDATAPILLAYHVNHVLTNNFQSSSPLTTVTHSTYYADYSNYLESTYQIQINAGCVHGVRGCR